MDERRHRAIITGEDHSIGASAWRAGLTAMAALYRPVVAVRNAMFDLKLRKAHPLGRPTVSVGNLTAGGTGKTPMVIDITQRLIAMGRRPAVLLRGYRAVDGQSDEARLLADALGEQARVAMHPQRRTSAARVLAADPSIDCFVLDDAFQHRQAARDLDLVLVDATQPFGHDRLLPRGLLREPVTALARAQGVLITRADLVSPEKLEELERRLAQQTGKPTLAHVAYIWRQGVDAHDEPIDLATLTGRRVLGVCGVGNPQAFSVMLAKQFGEGQPVQVFPDHHDYQPADIQRCLDAAREYQAQAIITTDKDWVKWRSLTPAGGWPLPIYRPRLAVRWMRGEAALDELLVRMLAAGDEAGCR